MEESRLNQRLLLAAVLSLGVMLGWRYIFPPPPPAKHPLTQTSPKPGASTATLAAAAPEVSTSSVVVRRIVVAPSLYSMHGAVGGADDVDAVPFDLSISNVGGTINSFVLTSFRERDTSNQATDRGVTLAEAVEDGEAAANGMAGIEFVDGSTFKLPPSPVFEVVERTDSSVKYRYVTDNGVEIEREYSMRPDSFEIEMAVTVRNKTAQPQRHRLQMNSGLVLQPAMKSGGFLDDVGPQSPDLRVPGRRQGAPRDPRSGEEGAAGLQGRREVGDHGPPVLHLCDHPARWRRGGVPHVRPR